MKTDPVLHQLVPVLNGADMSRVKLFQTLVFCRDFTFVVIVLGSGRTQKPPTLASTTSEPCWQLWPGKVTTRSLNLQWLATHDFWTVSFCWRFWSRLLCQVFTFKWVCLVLFVPNEQGKCNKVKVCCKWICNERIKTNPQTLDFETDEKVCESLLPPILSQFRINFSQVAGGTCDGALHSVPIATPSSDWLCWSLQYKSRQKISDFWLSEWSGKRNIAFFCPLCSGRHRHRWRRVKRAGISAIFTRRWLVRFKRPFSKLLADFYKHSIKWCVFSEYLLRLRV